MGFSVVHPLVNVSKTIEKTHFFKAGKTHYYPVVNGRSDKGSVWGIQKFPTNIPYLI